MELVQRLFDLGRNFIERQPTLALALCSALVAVFLSALFRQREPHASPYRQFCRLAWAGLLVALVGGAALALQSYLHRTVADFRHSHGRLTEVNLDAVRTIWGNEQVQGELGVALWWDEEQTERIESEDLSKPTVTRKKTIRQTVMSNPFLTTRHDITLRQNPRKKGSAVYAGYETDNAFQWLIRNPADRDVKATLRFPLPSSSAMLNDLTVTLNETNVLDRLRVENSALVLEEDCPKGATMDYRVAFKSRGLSYWYFQVREAREVRDFELLLKLPDLAKAKLNYPEGCMTPTEITPTGNGSVLAYRLDRAICNKGMGIQLPVLSQPGETTSAVLAEAEKGWVLLFAGALLAFTVAGGNAGALRGVFVGCAMALGYGLLGDLSDTWLGFWGGAVVVLAPMLMVLGWLTLRWLPGLPGKLVVAQLALFGALYPLVAGLDGDRRALYLNICAVVFLVLAAWSLSTPRKDSEIPAGAALAGESRA
jgi:hypothetical protein